MNNLSTSVWGSLGAALFLVIGVAGVFVGAQRWDPTPLVVQSDPTVDDKIEEIVVIARVPAGALRKEQVNGR